MIKGHRETPHDDVSVLVAEKEANLRRAQVVNKTLKVSSSKNITTVKFYCIIF